MKHVTLIMMIALMLFIPSCSLFKTPIVTKPEATVIQGAGDAIKKSADNIDGIVKGSEYEEPVKEETNNIREESEKLSYEQIEALYQPKFKKLQDDIKLKDKRIDELLKLVDKLKAQITDLQNFARKQQVTWLNIAAGILTVATGLLLYFRQKELAGYSAIGAVGAFGLAQILGSVWFFWICVSVLLILAGGVSYALYKQNVSNETETIVMKTLEEVYNAGTPEEKVYLDEKIFDKLSKKMSDRHKSYVRDKKI